MSFQTVSIICNCHTVILMKWVLQRIVIPGFKPVTVAALKICMITKIRPLCEVGPFLKSAHIYNAIYLWASMFHVGGATNPPPPFQLQAAWASYKQLAILAAHQWPYHTKKCWLWLWGGGTETVAFPVCVMDKLETVTVSSNNEAKLRSKTEDLCI